MTKLVLWYSNRIFGKDVQNHKLYNIMLDVTLKSNSVKFKYKNTRYGKIQSKSFDI